MTDIIFNPASKFIFGSEFTAAHIFTVVEFSIFISIFFYLMKRKYKRTIVAISTLIFLSAFIFENLIIKNIGFDSLSVGTSYIILIICSVISIGDTIKYNSVNNFFNTYFLTLAAAIIYFSGTLFIYVLSNSFYSNYDFNRFYYLINPAVITLRNILLFSALLKLYKDNKKQKLIVA